MKIIRRAVVVALLAGLPATGFAQADRAPEPPAREMKADSKTEAPKLTMSARKGRARAEVDARECLNFPTNREIHICAEKYLPKR